MKMSIFAEPAPAAINLGALSVQQQLQLQQQLQQMQQQQQQQQQQPMYQVGLEPYGIGEDHQWMMVRAPLLLGLELIL